MTAKAVPTCRLTGDWLPLPDAILADLGWVEGERLELEIVSGVLVVTPVNPSEPRVDADR